MVPLTAPVVPPKGPPIFADGKGATETAMQNVDFRIDELTILDIHQLRGVMVSKDGAGTPVNFDDKNAFVLKVDTGRIGMRPASLDSLMNRYVFAYPTAPLRQLHLSIDGKQLKQDGVIHKVIDIPFTMWADVSASDGRLRIHPTKISICGINGLGLLEAVGESLEKMIGKDLPHDKGVSAEGNDLLMDPDKMLPPPDTELHLAGVTIAGDELLMTFDAGEHRPPLTPPHAEEKNWMYFRGGTIRMGKLLMTDADMQVVDTDPSDAFDFFIDRYNDQLVAGFTRNQADYGLEVFMRDFADLGSAARAGERVAPK